jgi:mannose-6-phosphate isomerase-like protein (cupin superfamily)
MFTLFPIVLGVALLGGTQKGVAEQQSSGTYVSDATMMKILKDSPVDPITDVPVRTVDAGKHNVSVAIVRRTKADNGMAFSHDNMSETYVIREGSGTLVTGGRMISVQPNGGGRVEGGTSQRVVPGDIIIIPRGVPHYFSALDGTIVYSIVRVDPGQTMPLK